MDKSNAYTRLSSLFPSTLNATKKIIKPSMPATTLPDPNNLIAQKTVHQKIKDLLQEKDTHILVEKFKCLSEYSYFRDRCHGIYKLTVHRLSIAQNSSLIEQALESQKNYMTNQGFASRIIFLYGKYGMFDHAYKVFDEMPVRNCERGVKSFRTLLGAAGNSGKYGKVLELFRGLPEKLSIELDVDCYNTAMHALCKMGSVDEAVLLLDEMEGKGLLPNVVSFNTLLYAYYESGKCKKGDELWERMTLRDVIPDIKSYNFKLQGLVNDGKLLEALELATQLKDMKVKPNVCTFNAVILGLIKEDDLVCVKEWYGELIKSGCAPNKATFSTLVPYLCEKGDYELASEVCEKMLKGRHCLIDAAPLQCVVDELVKNSMADKAKVLVELGLSKGYAPYHLVIGENV